MAQLLEKLGSDTAECNKEYEKLKEGKELENSDFEALLSTEKLPSAGISFTILLLPVFLILCNTVVSQTAWKANAVGGVITFLGNPVIALFISLCLGAFVLAKDMDRRRSTE